MAVQIPAWFDWNAYLNNKLAQVGSGTMDSLVSAMDNAGFKGPEGYYMHFLQFGHKEDVSPSAGFDATQYYTFKAAQVYRGGDVSKVNSADISTVKQAIADAGMDAWTHYQKFGTAEMINASNSFDTAAYLQAKATAMGGTWTAATVATAIQNAGMNAYEHYKLYGGTGTGEVVSGATFTVDPNKQANVPGQTFTLTASADNFTGTAGNDTFNANVVVNPATGVAEIETLTNLDVLVGGEGTDTLNYTTVGGSALPAASISGIEIINVVSDGAAIADVSGSTFSGVTNLNAKAIGAAINIDTKSNVTAVEITGTTSGGAIDDNGAAGTTAVDKLATVSITGATGDIAIGSDALTALNLTKVTNGNATVTAAAATRTLTVTLNEVSGPTNDVVVTDDQATTLVVNTTGKASTGVDLQADKATSVTINADEKLTVTQIDASAAKSITVKGDSLVTFTTNTAADLAALETVSSADSTGGVSLGTALAAGVTFTGGAGKDTVALTAGTTKASTMGAGNDTVTLTGAFGAGGSVDAGDGTDTLSMTSANAATVSATTTFEAGIANFEKLKIGAVASGATDLIQLANVDDINYVVSAGTDAGVLGSTESALVTFQNLLSGQSVTVAGRTVTATNADLTAAQVEAAFLAGTTTGAATVSGTLTGWTVAESGANNNGVLAFTATTAGNVTDIATSSANSTAPTAPSVSTTQGVAAVTESSVVGFQGLIGGESVTVAGRTVNAGTFETAVFTAGAIANTKTITVGGYTLTSTGGHTAADVITVLTGGTVAGLVRTGTLDSEYTLAATTATTATFTRTTLGNDATNIAVGGTNGGAEAVVVDDGELSNLTAANVAALASSGTSIANVATVTGTLTGFNAGAASGNRVTFTSTGAGNVTDIVVSTTAGTAPTVTTTQGVAAVAEVSDVTFQALKSGQSVTVAGRVVTATGGDLTAAQVEAAYLANASAGNAVVTGTLAGFTVADTGTATDGVLRFTTTGTGNVTDITSSTAAATAPTAAGVATTQGGVGAAGGGVLNITGFGAAGTLELTGAITGNSSVALANSGGTSDVFNLKLNGTNQITNTATLTVAGVETINIEATDSVVDTPDADNPAAVLDNPSGASKVNLVAADATKIVVTGNHGVDFTGSTLAKVVELDASGVVSVGDAAGATAATIGAVGQVTFSSQIADKAVTVKTGNGYDVINVSSINDATFLATNVTASTIDAGAGNDNITGSAGKDVINGGDGKDTIYGAGAADTLTGGAGNDTFVYAASTDSTLAKTDVITDFVANTYGNGTSGAAGTGASTDATKLTGDVLKFTGLSAAVVADGAYTFVASNAADAQTFIQNTAIETSAAKDNAFAAALDSTTGKLYIDLNSDGSVDSVIQLTGVTTITAAAFELTV